MNYSCHVSTEVTLGNIMLSEKGKRRISIPIKKDFV